jgi:hypothetical protein
MCLFLPFMLVFDENAFYLITIIIIIRNRWRGESKSVDDHIEAIFSEFITKS